MNRSFLVVATLLLSLAFGSTQAQDGVLTELYGQGVHAYFSRDFQSAHAMFTGAIEQGTRDPRCFYYRGLTYASLGRPDEADADFKAGAAAEIGSTDRVYPVADSLQRVQGRMRVQIEKYRQVARLTSYTKATEIQRARYEAVKRSEQEVVRDPNRTPVAPPADTATQPPAEEKSDPFAGTAEAMPEKAAEKAAAPAVAAPAAPGAGDPFGTPAAEAAPAAPAAPAPADPFGTPAAPAAGTPAAPDDAKNDPFADDKPAGTTPPPPTPPETKPADGDDPFK